MMRVMGRCLLVPMLLAVVGCQGVSGGGSQDTKVALWNGADFEGWKLFIPDAGVDVKDVWNVRDGVVHCTGVPNGYMRTTKEYADYHLHVEWRWPEKPTNSGVLLHVQLPDQVWPKCIESQLHSGSAGDFWILSHSGITANGKRYEDPDNKYVHVKKKHDSSENPPGQWNTYDITCQGGTVRSVVNGVEQNYGTEATPAKGYIALQSEGSPIEFRNITIESLK
jgi:3-keto-disaccharide hydrolase